MNDPQVMLALARRALEHYTARSTDMAPDVMRMDVAAYLETTRYTEEITRIFKELPLALALSLELVGPGSFRTMTVLGVPVLLIRGSDGTARAFLNVCRHRGATLCAEAAGSKRSFSCPYHAWTYNDRGALMGIYAQDTFGEVDKSALGLTELFCAERSGLIWVGLTPGQQHDIDAWLGDFQAELDTLELANWHLFEQRELRGPGWKVAMDGYLEVYHHNSVHSGTVGQHTVGNLLVLDTFGPHQRLTFGRQTLGELANVAEPHWQPEKHLRLIHSGFPNLSISGVLNDHALVSQIFPGPTPDETMTRQTLLAAKPLDTPEAKVAAENFSTMILQAVRDEDYAIGLGVQAGLASGANKEFVFGRNEPAVQNYHRWVERFMAQEGSHYEN